MPLTAAQRAQNAALRAATAAGVHPSRIAELREDSTPEEIAAETRAALEHAQPAEQGHRLHATAEALVAASRQPEPSEPAAALKRHRGRLAELGAAYRSGWTATDYTPASRQPEPAAPTTRTCRHCDATIEHYPGTGWVDTLSGDDGGTYDNCPRGIDAPHQP